MKMMFHCFNLHFFSHKWCYKHSSLISFCSLLLIAFSCLLLIPYWLLVFCYQFVRNFGFSLVVFVLKFFLFLWGQILFSLCILENHKKIFILFFLILKATSCSVQKTWSLQQNLKNKLITLSAKRSWDNHHSHFDVFPSSVFSICERR